MEPTKLTGVQPGNFRWVVCALVFFATTINYMDRQVLSILAPVLQTEIGWNEQQYAHIVTAFQAAYAIGMLAFGRFVDVIGTRHGYAICLVLWSFAAMAHAAVRSVFGFGVARFALGLSEAGNFPAAIKAVTEWFPKRERALATGLFNSGTNVGAILAPLVVPWLTRHYGWPASFVVLGATGFVWLAFWYALYDSPDRSRRVSPEELAHILSDAAEPAVGHISWFRLLGYRQTWFYIVGYAFSAPIWWFYLYWLPKFLNHQHGLNLSELGLPLIVVYSMTCAGAVASGWFSGFLLRRGWSVNAARKTAMLLCALAEVPVVFAAHVSQLWLSTLLIGLAVAAHQGWASNLFPLAGDLFPKRAVASVIGLGGMIGAATSMALAELAGYILQTSNIYWPLFVIAASSYLVALAIMHTLLPDMKPAEFKDGES
jgi:MFS transporter, ACS family, hexuronate transporter